MTRIAARGTTPAPPSAVWALLADAAGWSTWSSFDESARLEDGEDGGDGVGALRRFRTGRNVSVERVVAFEADRHLAYVLISGLPLRDYRADVTLTPTTTGGTAIEWRSQFRGKVPGTGWVYGLALRTFLRRLVRQLGAAAEAGSAG